MAELENELGDLSFELLEEFGTNCILQVKTKGVYDPNTSANTPLTNVPISFKSLPEDMNGETFNGNSVITGDKKLTTSSSYFLVSPKAGDIVSFGEGNHTVMSCKKTKLRELNILYEIHARK